MATTITIPLGNDPFECTVNGVYHSYAAGTTVEVPDEVAALIQSIEGNDPPKTIPAPPVMPRGGSVGDVLTRTADGAEWAEPSGGGGGGSSGTMVVQFDSDNDRWEATWQEVHDAMTNGKTVIFVFDESDYLFHNYAVMATSADSNYRIGAVTVTSTEGNWDVDFISLSASGANGYLTFD